MLGSGHMLLLLLIAFQHSRGVLSATDSCPQNSVIYTGEYLHIIRNTLLYTNGSVRGVDEFNTTFLISPGAVENSYVIRKPTIFENLNRTFTNNGSVDTQDVISSDVESICVAPPYPGAGLECIDVEESGTFTVMPLEVEANCNMLKGWIIYKEPKLPGCDSDVCTPAVGYSTLILTLADDNTRKGNSSEPEQQQYPDATGSARCFSSAFYALGVMLLSMLL